MPPIQLPLIVHHDGTAHDLIIEAADPLTWGAVRTAICAELGLAEGTVLHYGVGPAQDDWVIGTAPLLAGCELATAPRTAVAERPPVILEVIAGPDAGRWVAVETGRITIGRDAAADLALTDAAVSTRHAELRCDATGMALRDLGSTNGVFVDGRYVGGGPVAGAASVRTGSIIRVGSSILRIRLTVEAGATGRFRPDGRGHLVRSSAPPAEAPPSLTLPPRPEPPEPHPRRAIPVISAVLGAAVGAGLALMTHNPLFLAFAAVGPATMIGTAAADRLRGRHSHRRALRDHRAADETWHSEVNAAVSAFRRAVWRHVATPVDLMTDAETAGARLWARRRGGAGYLAVTTGSGRLTPDGEPPDAAGLSLADLPRIDRLSGVWGFSGTAGRGAARWIIAQLVTTHSPADIQLRVIAPGPDLLPCRLIPHAAEGGDDLIVVLDGAAAITGPAGTEALRATAKGAEGSPVAVICLADGPHELPAEATRRMDHGTAIDAQLFARICRALIPMRESSADTVPTAVDLAGIIGPPDPATILRAWAAPTARATVGRGPEPIHLDLDTEGPHLLIAGTTGSGKSELLQTLITTWALAAPPTATTLLLVDYKGGAAFGHLAELPQVVGLLTDLDPALSARALASLRAEVHRRERLAATGGTAARLIIVIDEFATLAVELPEFLQGLIDIAQRGRSLGIHLVLATQRPAGVVSPAMRANISARICLRVTDPAESIDVIGTAEAAAISPRTPGRAILATGNGRVPFQTALATAPLPPPLQIRRATVTTGRTEAAANDAPLFTRAALAAIRAAHGDAPLPPRPWVPPLADLIPPTAADDGDLLAVADLPHRQCHEAMPAPNGSALICGPPRSGRTTALRRIAAAAARRGEELLVVDDVGDLADLRSWPQVSTYLRREDATLVLRLLTAVLEQPADRIRHLIVDRYDLMSAEVERADFAGGAAALAEIGGRSTIRLTATGPQQVRHGRLAGQFPTVIELDGPTIPGRGRIGDTLIQVVHCPPDSPGLPPPGAAHERPVVIRSLPTLVTTAELPSGAPHRVPIGLGGDASEPFAIDLAGSGGAIIVTGPRRSGVSTAVATIAAQAAASGVETWTVTLRLVSPSGRDTVPAGATRGRTAVHRIFDVRTGIEPLRAALADHDGPLLIAVDDATADHPAADLLDAFLRHCGVGQYLLLGERPDALTRARRGHLATALGHRRGLLLSPEPTDAMLLDATIPRRSGPVIPGRGLWTEGGGTAPVHIALPARSRLPHSPCRSTRPPTSPCDDDHRETS